jgi:hypothetical protein
MTNVMGGREGNKMIDTEVIRLRQLRNTVLEVRAIATALGTLEAENGSVFSRSALACWRIARVITGKLRAHPYQSYQRDAGYLRSLYDGAVAALMAGVARYRGGSFGMYSARLQTVARELDDVRALTWSPTLSDALGRSQLEIRALMKELAARAREEAGLRNDAAARIEVGAAGGRSDASGVAANWPYLAL